MIMLIINIVIRKKVMYANFSSVTTFYVVDICGKAV